MQLKSSDPCGSGIDEAIIKTYNIRPTSTIELFQPPAIYVIAGYENGQPSGVVMEFYIDWIEDSLVGPVKGIQPDFSIQYHSRCGNGWYL